MQTDYPAAHSMDTIWFAVDSAGQVGMFETGETGPAPRALMENDIREELWQLWKVDGDVQDGDWELDVLCERRGVYYFLYSDPDEEESSAIGLYERVIAPPLPVHIDQLPPDLRDLIREVRLGLRFDRVEGLQPFEFVPCIPYDPDGISYLAGDGKTVKPIPGKEKEFGDLE